MHAVDDEHQGMLFSRKGSSSRNNKSASSTASSSRRSRSDAGTSAAAAASKLAYKTTKNFRKSRFVAATDGVGGPAEEQKERHADELLGVPQDSNSNSSLSIQPTPRGSTPATSARASVKEQVKNYARQLAGAKSESKGARRTGIGNNYLRDQHAHAEDHIHTSSSTSGRAGFHCSPRGDGGSSCEAAGTETTDEVGATNNYMTTQQRTDTIKNQDPSSSSCKSKSSSTSGAALASARNNVPDNSAAPPKSSARSSSGLQNSQNLFTRHSVRAELLARPTMNSTAKARHKIDQQDQYYQSPAKIKQPSSSSLSPAKAKGKHQQVGTNNDKLAVLHPSSAQKQTASSAAAVSQNYRQSRTRTGVKGKRSNAEAATGSVPKALQRGLCPAGGPDQDLHREFRRNSAGRLAPHHQTGSGTAVEQDHPPPSSSRLSSTLRSSIVSKSRSSTGTKESRSGSKSFNTGDPTPGDWTQDMRRQLSFALGGGPGGPGASVNGPPHGRSYMMGGSSYQQNNTAMVPTMNNLEQHDHQHKQTAQEQLPGAAAPHAGTTASTAVLRNCDGLGLIQFQFNPVARGSSAAPGVNSSNSSCGQHRVVTNTNIASRASLLNVSNVVEHQQGQHSHSNSQVQLAADQTAVTNIMTGSSTTTSALGKILQAPALAPSLGAREQQQQQQRSYQFRSLSPPPGGRSLLNCDNQGTNGKTLNGGAAASSSAQPHMKMTSNPLMINDLNTRAGALSPPIASRRPEPVHSSQSQFQPLTVFTGRAGPRPGVGGFPGSQKALPRQVSAEAPEPPAFVGARMNKREVEMAVVKDKKSNYSLNKEQSAASSATDVGGGAENIKKPVPKHKESSSFRTRNRNAQTGRDHAAVDHKKSSGRQHGGIKAGGVAATSVTGNGKSLYGARNKASNKNYSAADHSLENTQQMLIKSARAYSTPPTSSRGGRNEDVGQQQQQQDQNQRQNFLQHHVQLNLNIPTFPQQQQQQQQPNNNFAPGAPILPTGVVQHPAAAHQNVNMWHPAARTGGTVNSMSCLQNTNEGRALELEQQQFPTQYVSAATTTSFLHQQLSPQLHTRNTNAVGASINNNFPTNHPAAGSTFKRFCSPQMQSRASVGTTNNLHGQNDPQRQRQNGVFRQMSAHPRARAVAGTVRENNLQQVELEAGHDDMNGKQKQFSGQQIRYLSTANLKSFRIFSDADCAARVGSKARLRGTLLHRSWTWLSLSPTVSSYKYLYAAAIK